MIEITLATIIITIIIVLTIRNTKRAVLENPVILNRTGQYHATLAPKLNNTQAFIEAIAMQMPARDESQNSSTQCFEVRDPEIAKIAHELYLLAITMRHGILYFQAIIPCPLINDQDSHFNMLMQSAHATLARVHATDGVHNTAVDRCIIDATDSAARKLGIDIKQQVQI